MKRFLLITFLALISISYAPTDESNNSVSLSVSFNEQAARSTTYEKKNTFDTSSLSSTKKEQADLLVVENKLERKTLEEDSEIVVLESEEQKRTENVEGASKTVVLEIEEKQRAEEKEVVKLTSKKKPKEEQLLPEVEKELDKQQNEKSNKQIVSSNTNKFKSTNKGNSSEGSTLSDNVDKSNATESSSNKDKTSKTVTESNQPVETANVENKKHKENSEKDNAPIIYDLGEVVETGKIPAVDEDGNKYYPENGNTWERYETIEGIDTSNWGLIYE